MFRENEMRSIAPKQVVWDWAERPSFIGHNHKHVFWAERSTFVSSEQVLSAKWPTFVCSEHQIPFILHLFWASPRSQVASSSLPSFAPSKSFQPSESDLPPRYLHLYQAYPLPLKQSGLPSFIPSKSSICTEQVQSRARAVHAVYLHCSDSEQVFCSKSKWPIFNCSESKSSQSSSLSFVPSKSSEPQSRAVYFICSKSFETSGLQLQQAMVRKSRRVASILLHRDSAQRVRERQSWSFTSI